MKQYAKATTASCGWFNNPPRDIKTMRIAIVPFTSLGMYHCVLSYTPVIKPPSSSSFGELVTCRYVTELVTSPPELAKESPQQWHKIVLLDFTAAPSRAVRSGRTQLRGINTVRLERQKWTRRSRAQSPQLPDFSLIRKYSVCLFNIRIKNKHQVNDRSA